MEKRKKSTGPIWGLLTLAVLLFGLGITTRPFGNDSAKNQQGAATATDPSPGFSVQVDLSTVNCNEGEELPPGYSVHPNKGVTPQSAFGMRVDKEMEKRHGAPADAADTDKPEQGHND
jgi:hypothetical protein